MYFGNKHDRSGDSLKATIETVNWGGQLRTTTCPVYLFNAAPTATRCASCNSMTLSLRARAHHVKEYQPFIVNQDGQVLVVPSPATSKFVPKADLTQVTTWKQSTTNHKLEVPFVGVLRWTDGPAC